MKPDCFLFLDPADAERLADALVGEDTPLAAKLGYRLELSLISNVQNSELNAVVNAEVQLLCDPDEQDLINQVFGPSLPWVPLETVEYTPGGNAYVPDEEEAEAPAELPAAPQQSLALLEASNLDNDVSNWVSSLGKRATLATLTAKLTEQGHRVREVVAAIDGATRAGRIHRDANGVYRYGRAATTAPLEFSLRSTDPAYAQPSLMMEAAPATIKGRLGLVPSIRVSVVTERAVELGNRTTLRSAEDAAKALWLYLDGIDRETLVVMCMDARNQITAFHTATIGTITESLSHPREVFRAAILHGAASVVLGHNHPSGDPSPSPADISTTKRLAEAGKLLGIEVLDHVIVGGPNTWVSLKTEGKL